MLCTAADSAAGSGSGSGGKNLGVAVSSHGAFRHPSCLSSDSSAACTTTHSSQAASGMAGSSRRPARVRDALQMGTPQVIPA